MSNGQKVSRSSLDVKRTTVSSAYSESSNEKSSPLAFGHAFGQDGDKPRGQVIVEIVDHAEVQRRQMGQVHHRQLALGQPQLAEHRFGP